MNLPFTLLTAAPVRLPLVLAAAAVALLAYWVATGLPWEPEQPPPPRRTMLLPLERWLRRELDLAGLNHLPTRVLLGAMLAASAAGGLLACPFGSGLLVLVGVGVGGLVPYRLVRARIAHRGRAVQAAVEPALVQIAMLCEVRRHPYLALTDALPLLRPPLKAEMERALAEAQAGTPLPEALRSVAFRLGDNFYLHQLAELVAINIRSGGDLSGSLQRLAARLRTTEELRAEEAAELFGYKWLTRILVGAALAPVPYWAVTGSEALAIFREEPLAQAVLVWVVVSGLVIASLPYWLALEE